MSKYSIQTAIIAAIFILCDILAIIAYVQSYASLHNTPNKDTTPQTIITIYRYHTTVISNGVLVETYYDQDNYPDVYCDALVLNEEGHNCLVLESGVK